MKINQSVAAQLQRLPVSREADPANGDMATKKKAAMLAARESRNPVTTASADPSRRPFQPGEGESLTVDGLLEEWGETGGSYDLDGSGGVSMADLLTLLAGQGPATGGGSTVNPGLGDEGAGFGIAGDATVKDTGEPASAPQELTLEGLRAAWGTDDAMYDLDGDGQVGMGDLTALLAQLATPPGAKPAPAETGVLGAAGEAGPAPAATEAPGGPGLLGQLANPESIDDIIEQWGQRDGSGLVDFEDLLEGLANGGPSAAADGVRPDGTLGDLGLTTPEGLDIGADAPVAGPQDLLQDLIDQWASQKDASPGSDFDDLLELLTKMGQGSGNQSQEPVTPDRVGDALFARLAADGFEATPPSNLPDLVGSLELTRSEQKDVLKNLSQRYPDGLGVSRLA